MPLSPKQQRFVAEYLIDGNGAQAAIRAGYAVGSAKVTASKLLTKANVRDALKTGQTKIAAKLEITAEDLLRDVIDVRNLAKADGVYAAALKANEMLGKSLGEANPFTDTINVNATIDDRAADPHELARLVSFLLTAGMQQPEETKPLH